MEEIGSNPDTLIVGVVGFSVHYRAVFGGLYDYFWPSHIIVSVSWLSCDEVKMSTPMSRVSKLFFFLSVYCLEILWRKQTLRRRLLSHSFPPCLSLSVRVHAGCSGNHQGQKSKTRTMDTIFTHWNRILNYGMCRNTRVFKNYL